MENLYNESKLILEFEPIYRYGEKYVCKNPFLGYKGEHFLEDLEESRQLWEMFAPKKSTTERYAKKQVKIFMKT